MRYINTFIFTTLMTLTGLANAQVFKCAAADGHLVYSDRPCSRSTAGGMIERERTYQEKLQERQLAFEAQQMKESRRQAEQEREWAENDQAMRYQAAPVVRHQGNDWQMRKDRDNAATSASSITKDGGRWDEAAAAQRRAENRRAAALRPPPPTNITNCNGGFCQDNQGGTYNRVSRDLMIGPNGRTCNRAGSTWNCH